MKILLLNSRLFMSMHVNCKLSTLKRTRPCKTCRPHLSFRGAHATAPMAAEPSTRAAAWPRGLRVGVHRSTG